MKTRRRLVYAGGIMLLLAGCGGDDNGDEATNGALQEPQGVERRRQTKPSRRSPRWRPSTRLRWRSRLRPRCAPTDG